MSAIADLVLVIGNLIDAGHPAPSEIQNLDDGTPAIHFHRNQPNGAWLPWVESFGAIPGSTQYVKGSTGPFSRLLWHATCGGTPIRITAFVDGDAR